MKLVRKERKICSFAVRCFSCLKTSIHVDKTSIFYRILGLEELDFLLQTLTSVLAEKVKVKSWKLLKLGHR